MMKTITSFLLGMMFLCPLISNAQIVEKMDSIVSLRYDTANQSYYQNSKTIMVYDSLNQNRFWLRYERDTSNAVWEPEDSAGYLYNTAGLVSQEFYGEWDAFTSRFVRTNRTDYYYNAANQITAAYYFNYNTNNNSWDSSYQVILIYGAGLLSEFEEYYWDDNLSAWIGDSKEVYAYNASNQLVQELEYNWDNNNSAWETQANNREDYIYNSSTNFLDSSYYFNYNSISMQFESTSRSVYTNDALGNVLVSSSQNLINPQGWVNTERASYGYTANPPLDQVALPIGYITDFDEAQVSKRNYWKTEQYDFNNSSLYIEDSTVYYYSSISVGINEKELQSLDFQIFPNPAKDHFKLALKQELLNEGTIRIISLKGATLLQQPLNGSNELSIESFGPGIYLVEVSDQNERLRSKLIIH